MSTTKGTAKLMAGGKGLKALSGAVPREEDKAAAQLKRDCDRDALQKLFGSGKTKTTKSTGSKQSRSLATFMKQTINLKPSVLFVLNEKKMKPSDKKFQQFVSMKGSKFPFPHADALKTHDNTLAKYEELKNMEPKPADFFEQILPLQAELDKLNADLRKEIILLADAVDALNTSQRMKKSCMSNDDMVNAAEWHTVEQALVSLGIADWVGQEIKKRDEAERAAAATAKAAQAAERAAQFRKRNTREDVIDLASNGSDEEPQAANTAKVATTTDKSGNKVAVDSLMASGTSHSSYIFSHSS